MAIPIHTPRVNNNDDFVRFSHAFVSAGAVVKQGDPIADIETDKATFTVEAEQDGYILGFAQTLGETIPVGSILLWMGKSPEDPIPPANAPGRDATLPGRDRKGAVLSPNEPTLKALMLLARFGLSADDIPASGERLTATDVLEYVRHRQATPEARPELPVGDATPLSATERGMVRTIAWHRQSAVPGYVEIEYATAPWQKYADEFQQRHGILLSPLLPLMAYRLVRLACGNPRLNATIVGDQRYQYSVVNLGFTLQSGTNLYLLSLKSAHELGEKEFVDALGALMRRGMKGKLALEETSGVTIGLTSMSRWEVTRHIPVLPPHASLMVAHAHGARDVAFLGASYDHRVLTGGEVAAALRVLSRPAGD